MKQVVAQLTDKLNIRQSFKVLVAPEGEKRASWRFEKDINITYTKY